MKTCSCNIIVRDAEDSISACLDSIASAGCFSEIVIAIDKRTMDRTLDIIASYLDSMPIILFYYRWGNDQFAGARNAALRHSTGDYIFTLDADEVLQPGFSDLLAQADGCAYYGHQISVLPDGQLMDSLRVVLFPNVPGIRWELPIHEQIAFSLSRLNIPILDSDCKVYHTGYDSAEIIRDKHLRNFPLLVEYINTHRTKDAQLDYILERYNESVGYLKAQGIF